MNNYHSGHWAEFLARNLFRLKGYRILASNYITGKGTHAGEVDFVAKKGKTLVFVEVKKRSTLENAAYAISETQKLRIRNGAEAFLKKHLQYAFFDIRFDVVLVKLPFSLLHLKNAF